MLTAQNLRPEMQPYIALLLERLRPLNPAKVILFGSQAYGEAHADSDLDLLVVLDSEIAPQTYREKESLYLQVARAIRDIRQQVSIDLIVHTQPMHAQFIALDSLFAQEVLNQGMVLYESHHV